MSETPTAGTYRLDGMLQGPAPPTPATLDDLERWTASAAKSGLQFHLSMDGGSFSIVADPTARRTSGLPKPDLDQLLSDALDALLSFLPAPTRTSVFSTVRSEEFRPGRAIQTLYTVGPDGKIATEQRTLDIETGEAPPEITPASIRRAILPGLVFLLLALFISSFFIDYRKLFTEGRDRVVPLKKEEVQLDASASARYVTIGLEKVDNARRVMIFKLTRGPDWKTAFSSSPDQSSKDWPTFLNHLAIHQGFYQVEFRDKDGQPMALGELSLLPLREKESALVAVPAKARGRIAKVVIRP